MHEQVTHLKFPLRTINRASVGRKDEMLDVDWQCTSKNPQVVERDVSGGIKGWDVDLND